MELQPLILLSHFLCERSEYLGNKENAIPSTQTPSLKRQITNFNAPASERLLLR